MCGDITDSVTNSPLKGMLLQTSDRYGWGPEVAPGYYKRVIINYDFPVCISSGYTPPGMLGVIGNPVYQISSFGVR